VNTELERDAEELWSLLFQIITDLEKRLAAYMATHALTPPQFFVLKTLVEHNGRCPIGQIAREHHLTNATLTGLVKRLEAMQPPLVARERSAADRRSVVVLLTEAGQERFSAVQAGFTEQLRAVLSLFSPEERRDILDKVATYARLFTEHFPFAAVEPG
jgi:DNA-binding MarR family transcriptional regulator